MQRFSETVPRPLRAAAELAVVESLPSCSRLPAVRALNSHTLLLSWLLEHRGRVDDILNRSGAVLFRGFESLSVADAGEVSNALIHRTMAYRDRSSPRSRVTSALYTSTEHPADQSIDFHCELSYSHAWPMRLLFFCIEAAEEGGETPLADTRRVLELLAPSTVEAFARKGVEYVRNLEPGIGLSWREVYQTDDPDEVDRECQRTGMECTWLNRDHLIVRWTRPAVRLHPETGDAVWFNHAAFFHSSSLPSSVRRAVRADDIPPFETRFGDGTAIPAAVVDEVKAAYEAASFRFAWRRGDVLLLDNMSIAHSRRPYRGNRRILLSMGEPTTGEVE